MGISVPCRMERAVSVADRIHMEHAPVLAFLSISDASQNLNGDPIVPIDCHNASRVIGITDANHSSGNDKNISLAQTRMGIMIGSISIAGTNRIRSEDVCGIADTKGRPGRRNFALISFSEEPSKIASYSDERRNTASSFIVCTLNS